MAKRAWGSGVNSAVPGRGLEMRPVELVGYSVKAACWTLPAWLVAALAGYAASQAVMPLLPAAARDFAASWVGSPAWYALMATGAAAFLFATFSLNRGRVSCSGVVTLTSLGALAAVCAYVASVLVREVPDLSPADLALSTLALGASFGSALALPLVMGLLHGMPDEIRVLPLTVLQAVIGLAGIGLCLFWDGLGRVLGMLVRAALVTVGILVALELLNAFVLR